MIRACSESENGCILLFFVPVYQTGMPPNRTSVADPDPGSGAFLTPGSEIRNRYNRYNFFHPSLCCCFWIRDPVWVKIRIRDKHPGSATLCLYGLALYERRSLRACNERYTQNCLQISKSGAVLRIRDVNSGSELSPSRIRMLTIYPSRIQGSKRYRFPDPGSGSATLQRSVKLKFCIEPDL